jgi:hypothetical protein
MHHGGGSLFQTTHQHKIPFTTTTKFALSDNNNQEKNRSSVWRSVLGRLDTVEAAGYTAKDKVLAAGLFGKIKQLHNPITYFVLGILAGFRWDWCFKSPIYWFAIGFTIKWYRARYVFKIPVWDRQPNWNNIITNKEQEKDLKAYTCKVCGSTIFIAKTREFFFEGNTGIGGLGCFSCGAKGKENFIMDRDRIVEDVGDMDDYFEYERPLDFISRAERRKLLKEAKGDEERANQLLLDRAAAGGADVAVASVEANPATETTVDFVDAVVEEEISVGEEDEVIGNVIEEAPPETQPNVEIEVEVEPEIVEKVQMELPQQEEVAVVGEAPAAKTAVKPVKKVKAPIPSTPKPESTPSSTHGSFDLDGLEELDMDAW